MSQDSSSTLALRNNLLSHPPRPISLYLSMYLVLPRTPKFTMLSKLHGWRTATKEVVLIIQCEYALATQLTLGILFFEITRVWKYLISVTWQNCMAIKLSIDIIAGVRPYKCNLCEKSFTQRCSLESHCLKVHGVQHQYAYKERRTKVRQTELFHLNLLPVTCLLLMQFRMTVIV
jgi:hypothetical protein